MDSKVGFLHALFFVLVDVKNVHKKDASGTLLQKRAWMKSKIAPASERNESVLIEEFRRKVKQEES